MSHAPSVKFVTIAFLAIVALGCNKNRDETRSNATQIEHLGVNGSVVTDFPTLDAKAWVNGSPVSLDAARGKHVVLIEAWHPA